MRLLSSCYEFPPVGGGGGVVAEGLGRALTASGHRVDLVTMAFRGLPREEISSGLRVHRVPSIRRRPYHCTVPEAASYLLPAHRALRRLSRTAPYDLLHSHFLFPDGLLARLLSASERLPYVVTAHGSDVPGFNPNRLRAFHAALAPLWRRVARGAARVVCPSERLRALVVRACPEARTEVIPNGFDASSFRPDRPKRPRIVASTRLLERKGIQHLLLAIAGLDLDREVHVAGDGPFLEALRPLAERTRMRVEFRGWLSNRSPEYVEMMETSDIFVFPSRSENCPLVLLEAMAAGMAIVTTRGTGCDEVVGDAAILVPPDDPSAIREAIVSLDASPGLREALGRAARERLLRRNAWLHVADRYAHLFEEVLGPPGERARIPRGRVRE